MDFLSLVGDVGFPIAGAIAAGVFVFTTLKFILASVTGSVNGLKNIPIMVTSYNNWSGSPHIINNIDAYLTPLIVDLSIKRH